MTPKTYTVTRSWSGGKEGSRTHWVTLRGVPLPVPADQPFEEGAAVRIVDGRAVR